MRKIGLMGGTFNPPHIGHCIVAKEVQEACGLDEIWFVVSGVPPHKESTEIASNIDRKKMVEAAIEGEPSFSICTIELEREGITYTYDTMKELVKRYPDDAFYFIIGGDMVEYLPKWYRIDELIKLVTFIGVGRPGYERISPYPVQMVDVLQIDISSSLIRERIKEGRNIKYFVPDGVYTYIREKALYESK
ncbi:MAG: nicotinate-nucleotide adenylyltransferase [Bacillaceae bacterium]